MSKLQINNLFFYWYVQDTVSSVALLPFAMLLLPFPLFLLLLLLYFNNTDPVNPLYLPLVLQFLN